MKWLLSAACALSGCATSPEAATACDVTAPTFCFALPWHATSTLSMPADFALYEIALEDGAKVLVYDGRHPSKPDAVVPVYSEGRVSLYLDAARRFDAYYEAPGGGVVHVGGTVTDARREAVRRLLSSFRKCERRARDTIVCSRDAFFVEAAARL